MRSDVTLQEIADELNISAIFNYRTLYLPDSTSIDTFATDYKSLSPEIAYLKNSGVPFEAASKSGGRWGILSDWITTEPIKNMNGYGGWDKREGNTFVVQSGYGAPAITNGKIYQTVILPPGTYTFKAILAGINCVGDGDNAYVVAGKGNTLPDVEGLENSASTLGYEQVLQEKGAGAYTITFTTTEQEKISAGFAVTQAGGKISKKYPGTPNGRYTRFTSFEFIKK